MKNRDMWKKWPVLASVVLALSGSAFSQVPQVLDYQGRLIDGDELAQGTTTVVFRVYSIPTGETNILYQEADTVTMEDGFYSTPIGDNAAPVGSVSTGSPPEPLYASLATLFNHNGAKYLDIEIGGSSLSPRQAIRSTAYSLLAQRALGVPAGAISSEAIQDGSVSAEKLADGLRSTLDGSDGSVTSAVSVDAEGNVGVGTGNPAAGLHVSSGAEIAQVTWLADIQDGEADYDLLESARSVFVSGNYAYIAAVVDDSLTIVDVSDPSNPLFVTNLTDGVGGFNDLDGAADVWVSGNYAYVAAYHDDAITIVDVSNPAAPAYVTALKDGTGGYNLLEEVIALTVLSNHLYAVSYADDGLTVVDVSDPTTPSLSKQIQDGSEGFNFFGGLYDIAAEGNRVYALSAAEDAVSIIGVTNPASPTLIHAIRNGAGPFSKLDYPLAIAVSGDYLYVASFMDSALTIADISNPTLPALVAEYEDDDEERFHYLYGIYSLEVFNDRLYISDYSSDAVTVADVSDPTDPWVIAEVINDEGDFEKMNGPMGVFADGDTVYVTAQYDDSMTIFEVSSTESDGSLGLSVNGRVGIFTTTPSEALEVHGNIKADNLKADYIYLSGMEGDSGYNVRVSSSGLLYSSERKYPYYSIPPSAFRPYVFGSSYYAYGSTYARMSGGSYAMYAPVNLPDDSEIRQVDIYYEDDSSTDLDFYLQRSLLMYETVENIAYEATSGTPGNDSATIYSAYITNGIITNATYSYHFKVDVSGGSWDSNLKVLGVRIYLYEDD